MDLRLRRGTDRDAVAVSALYLRARKAAKATIPMTAHTDDETRRWIAERVVPHTELWVAEDDGGALVGLLVLDEDRVDQPYVEPTFRELAHGLQPLQRQRPTAQHTVLKQVRLGLGVLDLFAVGSVESPGPATTAK